MGYHILKINSNISSNTLEKYGFHINLTKCVFRHRNEAYHIKNCFDNQVKPDIVYTALERGGAYGSDIGESQIPAGGQEITPTKRPSESTAPSRLHGEADIPSRGTVAEGRQTQTEGRMGVLRPEHEVTPAEETNPYLDILKSERSIATIPTCPMIGAVMGVSASFSH